MDVLEGWAVITGVCTTVMLAEGCNSIVPDTGSTEISIGSLSSMGKDSVFFLSFWVFPCSVIDFT